MPNSIATILQTKGSSGNCSPLCGSLTRVDGIECGLPG